VEVEEGLQNDDSTEDWVSAETEASAGAEAAPVCTERERERAQVRKEGSSRGANKKGVKAYRHDHGRGHDHDHGLDRALQLHRPAHGLPPHNNAQTPLEVRDVPRWRGKRRVTHTSCRAATTAPAPATRPVVSAKR
jgi:hypothetical protein